MVTTSLKDSGIKRVLFKRINDYRATAAPTNKLTLQEQEVILTTCNLPEYAHLPPSQIVPSLLDKAIYYASESSFIGF